MRRLNPSLLLAAAILFALPALAGEAPAGLFTDAGCGTANMSVAPEGGEPDYVSTAGPCNVSRQCDDGSIISCSGQSTCISGPGTGGGYVECDGDRTWCPVEEECSDGEFCKYDSMCGTCYGAPCFCVNRSCICL